MPNKFRCTVTNAAFAPIASKMIDDAADVAPWIEAMQAAYPDAIVKSCEVDADGNPLPLPIGGAA